MALMRVVAAATTIAERAGGVLREIMASGKLGIVDKGGLNNLQTEADRKAQLLIVSSLMAQFPEVSSSFDLELFSNQYMIEIIWRNKDFVEYYLLIIALSQHSMCF